MFPNFFQLVNQLFCLSEYLHVRPTGPCWSKNHIFYRIPSLWIATWQFTLPFSKNKANNMEHWHLRSCCSCCLSDKIFHLSLFILFWFFLLFSGDIVDEFYNDSVILITGGTGFIGKVLVEKLLRSFNIKKIYLLVRSKNNLTVDERIQDFFKESVRCWYWNSFLFF